jgi:hypothetical protein
MKLLTPSLRDQLLRNGRIAAAHAENPDRPFLSRTGYRSFLSIHADAQPGLTLDDVVSRVIEAYVAR